MIESLTVVLQQRPALLTAEKMDIFLKIVCVILVNFSSRKECSLSLGEVPNVEKDHMQR